MKETYLGEKRGRVARVLLNFGFVEIPGQHRDAYFDRGAVDQWPACKEGTILQYQLYQTDVVNVSTPYIARNCRVLPSDYVYPSETRFSVGAGSSTGRTHTVCEDDFLVKPLPGDERLLLAVADGLSNPKGTGDWAASEVLAILIQKIDDTPFGNSESDLSSTEDVCRGYMQSLINSIQEAFIQRQKSMTTDRRRACSTLALCVVLGAKYAWASAGDSFILDVDFSGKRNPAYIAGSAQERRDSRVRGAIGDRWGTWQPRIGFGQLSRNHGLMLCTDGVDLSDSSRFISSTLTLDEIAQRICDASIQKGKGDDATVILFRN
jgi:serine/threonine protein phosphatase PrpC